MTCPICGETHQDYLFVISNLTIVRCAGCGLVMTSPLHKNPDFGLKYGISPGGELPVSDWTQSNTEKYAASTYFQLLKSRIVEKSPRVLIIAESNQAIKKEAEEAGWQVWCYDAISFLKSRIHDAGFDCVMLIYQLEKSHEPDELLKKIHRVLKPGGMIMIVTPNLESDPARFFGNSWTEWRPENRFYFDNKTLQLLMWRSHFNQLELLKDQRSYTLAYIHDRAKSFPTSWVTRAIRLFNSIFPPVLRNRNLRLPSSGIIAIGKSAVANSRQVCSIVLPAFNESKTFPALMDGLLSKKLPGGLLKEIIVVESNSKDGTREQVMKYKDHRGVKVVLQDHPLGKGNAVRAGFEQASGDILFIQDADLEYDLNDLDILLEPLIKYQAPFVLGSRHGGQWKMRQFTNEQGLSTFFNFGHQLFTGLLNLMYGQHLKDPFTMYKLFRRDCIYGLKFDSNRFDFDFELVIKLIRKGYLPCEIPINYHSRSFKEGKKVRVLRDPLTWVWALLKYRFADIYKKETD